MLRSLMLIYLLDKAKCEGIFTRCLFRPEAVYKSSLAVLQALGARLTPSIGDITRHLKHLSYDVGYVQYPLQEYVYRITNAAVDLRDGVLLTRLVELLCCLPAGLPPSEVHLHDGSPSWALSQYLKFPCLGRAQKLYNVQIALDALSGCVSSTSIVDGVKAEDIVDGHREKTLGLLWSLVSRFGFCKLLDLVDFTQEVEKWRQNKKGLGTTTSESTQSDAARNMVAYNELLQIYDPDPRNYARYPGTSGHQDTPENQSVPGRRNDPARCPTTHSEADHYAACDAYASRARLRDRGRNARAACARDFVAAAAVA
ncbi:hypothetical protein LTR28_005681 [Elasticomyces elasticus]|nr:hypothetical protein LTR28_005681 [Elasticomyces elasticus]